MVEANVQRRVDFIEFGAGKIDAPLPDGEVFRVAGLEPGEFGAAGVRCRRIGVAEYAGFLVNAHQLGQRIFAQRLFIEEVFPPVDDLAELRAPVAEMVVGDDLITHEPRHARQAIADDRRAQVADVHRLGDVRAAEVDHHHGRRLRQGHAEARGVGVERAESVGQELRPQAEIDEPRARDLRRRADRGQGGFGVERGHDLRRQGARIGPARLGEGHGGVGLVIAEPRIRRRVDRRVEISGRWLGQRGQGAAEDGLELGGDGRHEGKVRAGSARHRSARAIT